MYIFQPYRFLIRKIIKKYGHYIKGRVVDAGSGNWPRYKQFFNFTEYLTLDIDKAVKPDILGSIEKIPLPNLSIDSIVCTGVLGDVYKPSRAIKEFNRVLKNGGCCLLVDNFFGFIHDRPLDYFRFTNYYLEKIFSENGFELICCKRIGGFFSMMAQAKIEYLISRFNLYQYKILGRIASRIFSFCSYFMIFLDKIDKSQTNKNFTIGWLIIAKKIKDVE